MIAEVWEVACRYYRGRSRRFGNPLLRDMRWDSVVDTILDVIGMAEVQDASACFWSVAWRRWNAALKAAAREKRDLWRNECYEDFDRFQSREVSDGPEDSLRMRWLKERLAELTPRQREDVIVWTSGEPVKRGVRSAFRVGMRKLKEEARNGDWND